MMSNKEIAKICGQELEAAVSLAQSADDGTMQAALDYSEGRRPDNDDPEDDENREAVSLDVADMVEAVYAQIAPALEDVGGVQFDASGADDEPQALRESAIVRSMLMEGYAGEGGFVALSEQIKDALLLRTGILAVWIEKLEERNPEEWEAVPALALADILKPQQEGQILEGVTQEESDEKGPGGEPLFNVSLTRVNVDKRLCSACVPRENFVTSSITERDLNKIRFCADRLVTSRARLVAEGFDEAEVAKLKRHDESTYELHLHRREAAEEPSQRAAQDATETVEVWRCYVQLAESKKSMQAARYRVYFSRDNQCVLGKPQKVGRVCYAIGNVILYPHRMDGVSLFDRIGEIQEIKSKALRNWIENSNKVNRPRMTINESIATMADAQDATNDLIRVTGPGALEPVPTVDAGPSLNMLLQFADRARSERGGAALDMQASATTQIASNQTAQGIERQYSVKEQLAAMMARTLGETALRSAFQIAHYLLRTQWGGPLNVKVEGEWLQVDPGQWKGRSGVRIRIGQSDSQRAKRMVSLDQVLQKQMTAMQSGMGGILTDESRIYNSVYDWSTTAMLPGPERYWIDPKSEQAQRAAQGKQQQQAAQLQAQGDGMRAAMMLEKYKVDAKSFTDLVKTMVDAAIEEAKLTLSPAPIEAAQDVAAAGAGQAAEQQQASLIAGAPKPQGNGAAGPAQLPAPGGAA
jgi:hypothetical protein